MLLGELTERHLDRKADRPAIYFKDQVITFAEVDDRVNKVANALIAAGIEKGDRVAVHTGNRPEFVYAYYGVVRAGGVMISLNAMYKAGEVEFMATDSEVKAAIVQDAVYPVWESIRGRIPTLRDVFVTGATPPNTRSFDAVLEGGSSRRPQVDCDEDDVAVVCYTGGSTGTPKGAMLTHRNFISNAQAVIDLERFAQTDDDISMLVLPIFHIYCLNVGLGSAMQLGYPTVLVERFDPALVLDLLEKYRVTVFYGAPPMYVAMSAIETDRKFDLDAVRIMHSGAAALPVPVLERFEARHGIMITEGYGLTECSPVVCSNGAAPANRAGSIGYPIPGVQTKAFDDDDNEVAPGEVGELVVRGPNVFAGYLNKEDATREAFTSGWFHTGDMARIEEDGYHSIVDRKKEMVNMSGFNVYPREVEELLYKHPKIVEAAVIGVPDDYSGEAVKAFIVPAAGETLTAEDVIQYCRDNLAVYKAPRHVEFRDALPKLTGGAKIDKVTLKGEEAQKG
ncbi:MAG: long-chain fatty acid--CoA ligase [Armatimonadota bacterium]|nr:MAG: long-chain fatty acid--CoA ligase [Armatimonadota bacterium]